MSLKTRILSAIVSDLKTQYRCPSKSLTAKLLTKYWSNESFPLVETVVNQLNVKKDDRILEIGYGLGDGIELVRTKLNKSQGNGCIFGLEASRYMDELANKRFLLEVVDDKNIVLDYVPNLAHLPYPNETFDSIYHVDVFYFWNTEGLPMIVKELNRITKPGGKVICGMELEKCKRLEKSKVLSSEEFDPMRYTEHLEPAGFIDIKIDYKKISNSREALIISANKQNLTEDDLDPEVKMKKLEEEIKTDLALASLVSSKRAMSSKLKQKMEDSQGI